MWLRQSALHSGGPNFKASLHPSTNCGQAAKVSVGEELFTGLFSVSSLLMREPCQKRGFVCQNRARLLQVGEKESALTVVCEENTLDLSSFLSSPSFASSFFFLFFLVLLRQGFYDNRAQSHWVWLTFSSLLFSTYKITHPMSYHFAFNQILLPHRICLFALVQELTPCMDTTFTSSQY